MRTLIAIVLTVVALLLALREYSRTDPAEQVFGEVPSSKPKVTTIAEVNARQADSAQAGQSREASSANYTTVSHPDDLFINWSSVEISDPIPREMPSKESDNPYDAGFARDWVDRSLGTRTAFSNSYGGSPLVDPKPFIVEIISEPKDPDDNWSYGVEFELRHILERAFISIPRPAVTRVFCNRHGCLVYLEFDGARASKVGAIPHAILGAPSIRAFGIKREDLFDLVGSKKEPRIDWQLIVIRRRS